MSEIYKDGRYLANNPYWHSTDSPWKANEIYKILKSQNISPKTIVEVGCGAGGVSIELSMKLPEAKFVGYDISPQALEIAKLHLTHQVKFVLGDFFLAEAHQHDLAICADVFEHIEDHLGFLRTLALKQDLVVFHIPLDLSVASRLMPSILTRTRELVGHLHFFNKQTAESTLTSCGFKIIKSQVTAGCLEFPEPGFKGKLLWFIRKVVFLLSPSLAAKTLGGFSLLVLAKSDKNPAI